MVNADAVTEEKADRAGTVDIESLLEQGEVIQLHPQGYSMYPMFIPGRDQAVIGRADTDKLRRGDVVLYRRENSILVLHRIWAVRPEGIYLIGDNQMEVEGPLRPEQVRGILLAFIRRGRKISVKNPVYVLASRLWMLIKPLRGAVRRVRQRRRGTEGHGS